MLRIRRKDPKRIIFSHSQLFRPKENLSALCCTKVDFFSHTISQKKQRKKYTHTITSVVSFSQMTFRLEENTWQLRFHFLLPYLQPSHHHFSNEETFILCTFFFEYLKSNFLRQILNYDTNLLVSNSQNIIYTAISCHSWFLASSSISTRYLQKRILKRAVQFFQTFSFHH